MSLTDVVAGVTVTTTHQTAVSKQDLIAVSLRDIDPDLEIAEVEALVHRGVVRAIIDYNKETSK